MGRPRLFAEVLSPAQRSKRHRLKKRLGDGRPAGYSAPATPVTKAATPITKPRWVFDPKALIG